MAEKKVKKEELAEKKVKKEDLNEEDIKQATGGLKLCVTFGTNCTFIKKD